MTGRLGRVLIAFILFCGLATGAAAQAQPAGPEAERLALLITHQMFSQMDLGAEIAKGAGNMGDFDRALPGSGKLAEVALREELDVSMPRVERVMAASLATKLTLPELQAGATILSDPLALRQFAAGARGEKISPQACGKECMTAITSPAGKSLLRKLSDAKTLFGPEVEQAIVRAIIPGFLRRLADKIDAQSPRQTP